MGEKKILNKAKFYDLNASFFDILLIANGWIKQHAATVIINNKK